MVQEATDHMAKALSDLGSATAHILIFIAQIFHIKNKLECQQMKHVFKNNNKKLIHLSK